MPSCGTANESDVHVDVPVTVRGLEEYAREESFEFEKHRATRSTSSSGGSCGHSPVCILVPIAIAAQTLFPPRYDVVTVRDGDRVMIQAAFETNGALITMRARDGGAWREIRALLLTRISRRPVVEVARTTILADGGDGARRSSAILEQIDLREDYDRALEGATDSYARGAIVAEALLEIGEEMLPWGRAWMRAETTSGEDLAQLVEPICRTSRGDAIEGAVIEVVLARASIEGLRAAMSCDDARVIPAVVAIACDPARDPNPALTVLNTRPWIHGEREALSGHASECGDRHRRVLLALEDGADVEEAPLRAAVLADPHANAYVERLRHAREGERRILFERIASATNFEARSPAARRLAFRGNYLDAGELAAIARGYRAAAREENPHAGAELLWLLAVARRGAVSAWNDGTEPAPPATDVRPALAELADDAEAPAVARKRWAAGRIALGDASSAALAIENLSEPEVRETVVQVVHGDGHHAAYIPYLENDATLVAWAIHAAGCAIPAIREAFTTHDAEKVRECIR